MARSLLPLSPLSAKASFPRSFGAKALDLLCCRARRQSIVGAAVVPLWLQRPVSFLHHRKAVFVWSMHEKSRGVPVLVLMTLRLLGMVTTNAKQQERHRNCMINASM